MLEIQNYTGYRHNRYDGFCSTWGVLMALGASRTADAFADEDDYPDEAFGIAYNGDDPEIGDGNNDTFREDVLANLDGCDLQALRELEAGETLVHSEYWGQYKLAIEFSRNSDGQLLCDFDGQVDPFPVTVEKS